MKSNARAIAGNKIALRRNGAANYITLAPHEIDTDKVAEIDRAGGVGPDTITLHHVPIRDVDFICANLNAGCTELIDNQTAHGGIETGYRSAIAVTANYESRHVRARIISTEHNL